MTIQKVNTSRNTATRSTYVGEKGRLFYDETNGTLYISDGRTAGGSSIFNKLVNGNYSATLDASGNFTIPGNLTVQGTTTTVVNETVTNNETLTGTLTVSGTSTLTYTNLSSGAQNLLYQTSSLSTIPWSTLNATITGGQSDPFGGTTAFLITPNTTNTYNHGIQQSTAYGNSNSQTYLVSFYAKANGYSGVSLDVLPGNSAQFDLTGVNSPAVSNPWSSPTQTSVGNGWYKCTALVNCGASVMSYLAFIVDSAFISSPSSFPNYAGNGTSGIYFANLQMVVGTTPIAYVATTSSVITGNPQLSFASSGYIQQDISNNILITPGGTGTVQLGNSVGNYIQISNATTGNVPILSVQGVDATRSLQITSKGTTFVYIQNNNGSVTHFSAGGTSAAVNYLNARGMATGGGAQLEAVGTDSNINLNLVPKGNASVLVPSSQPNFFAYSTDLTQSVWSGASNNVTVTAAGSGVTDPLGGTSAWLLTDNNINSYHGLVQAINYDGTAWTFSFYAKAGTQTSIGAFFWYTDAGIIFNLSGSGSTSVMVGNSYYGGPPSSTSITALSNGWYRCSATLNSTPNANTTVALYMWNGSTVSYANGGSAGTVYIYGPQIEPGTTAGTYTPTGSTLITGYPTLSLSSTSTNNYAQIMSDSLGSIILNPTLSGTIQANPSTGTTAGGNSRGAYAVDLQTSRSANTQVASGSNSVITGGYNNTASGSASHVGGGLGNSVPQANAAIVGGANNTNNSYYGFIGGGGQNSIGSQDASVIVGGRYNTASGFYNFIGGGSQNTGQSGSAVTTCTLLQSVIGMMYIAVTNTNSSVRVGMLMTGTGIAAYTYVNSYAVNPVSASAMTTTISGTTLTVASGFTGTLAVGSTLTGGSISPAGTYITGQLTAANSASATPTLSAQANSAATTLSVSSASGIQINMFVASSSGGSLSGLPANTYVISIVGTTVTISNALTGTISSGTSIGFFTAGLAGTYSLSGTTPSGTPTNGTAYTIQLSQQVASTQTSGTIGFYLTGSTVVGGAKNTASGLFSFIGGGGGWTTASNQLGALNNGPNANTASGDWSTIGGGTGNVASGAASTIAGGGSGYSGFFAGNTASGYSSSIMGGGSNSASAQYSSILGGLYNTASGDYSVAMGYMANTKGNQGSIASSQIRFASNGDNQTCTYLLSLLTSDATPRQMVWSGINATNTVYNYNIIAMSRGTNGYLAAYCHTFRGMVNAYQPSTNDAAGWQISGMVLINSTTLVASFVGTPTITLSGATSGASTWAISMSLVNSSPNTSNGFSGYTVQVTGVAATTIHWSARIDTVEVG